MLGNISPLYNDNLIIYTWRVWTWAGWIYCACVKVKFWNFMLILYIFIVKMLIKYLFQFVNATLNEWFRESVILNMKYQCLKHICTTTTWAKDVSAWLEFANCSCNCMNVAPIVMQCFQGFTATIFYHLFLNNAKCGLGNSKHSDIRTNQ